MCGRYAASGSPEDLIVEYDAVDGTGGAVLPPDYNIAPTDPVLAVRTRASDGGRELSLARWGLVPSWAPDRRVGARYINARAETVQQLPAFRSAFTRHRCLIPADGWYEWVASARSGRLRRGTYVGADPPGRQAYYVTPYDGSGIAFAGLWEVWGERRLLTVTILTSAAVGPLAEVHSRMPLVLPPQRFAAWLDPSHQDPRALLEPTPDDLVARLEIRPVGPRVGNVANDGPELTRRVEPSLPADRPGAQLLF